MTFADFEFDGGRRRLKQAGVPLKLTGQALDLLCILLERPGEIVTRQEIQRRLWPDSNVEFSHSLDVLVSRLRSALGDSGRSSCFIETLPKKGYRFVEPVAVVANRVLSRMRQIGIYAAVAVLASVAAILFVHSRYQKFIPVEKPTDSHSSPKR
jgi:DNA-binding winged helix-turn-helix (wHTH) protein